MVRTWAFTHVLWISFWILTVSSPYSTGSLSHDQAHTSLTHVLWSNLSHSAIHSIAEWYDVLTFTSIFVSLNLCRCPSSWELTLIPLWTLMWTHKMLIGKDVLLLRRLCLTCDGWSRKVRWVCNSMSMVMRWRRLRLECWTKYLWLVICGVLRWSGWEEKYFVVGKSC